MPAISGFARDANNNPVQRTIRVYRRDTGALLGEVQTNASTGAYSLTDAYTGEVQVVMLDDAAGSVENDQILRTTPV